MHLTPKEEELIIEQVLKQYRGAKAVRIKQTVVEVRIPIRYDSQGRCTMIGWFECGTPEYWHSVIQNERVPVFPPM